MKKHFAVFVFVFLMLGLCVPPIFSQATGTVKGVCKDLARQSHRGWNRRIRESG